MIYSANFRADVIKFLEGISKYILTKHLLLLNQILDYLQANDILSQCQYGFSKGRSTISAILDFINNVFQSFESKKFYSTSFLDLSKAFDLVNHNKLLAKL
ncbi:hypothetical protein DD592_27270 [Enterobacter cloacae complex sp. 2DZ2F20B]|nr:hypothetical protein DD592_27270 [Enterobacter cloacae complex sp. 2DZ2F20B]